MCECESEWVDVTREPKRAAAWSSEQTVEFIDDLLDQPGHSVEVRDHFLALKEEALRKH